MDEMGDVKSKLGDLKGNVMPGGDSGEDKIRRFLKKELDEVKSLFKTGTNDHAGSHRSHSHSKTPQIESYKHAQTGPPKRFGGQSPRGKPVIKKTFLSSIRKAQAKVTR